MSDKLLKDGLRTSGKIGGMSTFAELLFVRLILATCPLGRCPWSPEWILKHALPNRPRTRLTTIADALKELRTARVVTRYSGSDGTAFLTIPRHGQRFKHAVRSPWPAPPEGPPDAEGQEFFGFEEKEEKRRGGRAPEAPDTTPAPPVPSGIPEAVAPFASASPLRTPSARAARLETDEQWLARLTRDWPGVDVPAQLEKAHRKRRGDVERGWFEEVWLPGVTPKAPRGLPAPRPAPAVPVPMHQAVAEADMIATRAKFAQMPEPTPGTLDHALWTEARRTTAA